MSPRHRDPSRGVLGVAAVTVAVVGSFALYQTASSTGVEQGQVATPSITDSERPGSPSAADQKVVAGPHLAQSPRSPSVSRDADRPDDTDRADSPTGAGESESPDDAEPTADDPTPTPVRTDEAAPTQARRALVLANDERAEAGCPPLVRNATLASVAAAHSADMATQNYFDHTSLDGRSAAQRMTDAGYSFSLMAENIAAGQPSAEAAMAGWMDSDGHRDNLLNCELTQTGIGVASDPDSDFGIYWTQVFGTPAG